MASMVLRPGWTSSSNTRNSPDSPESRSGSQKCQLSFIVVDRDEARKDDEATSPLTERSPNVPRDAGRVSVISLLNNDNENTNSTRTSPATSPTSRDSAFTYGLGRSYSYAPSETSYWSSSRSSLASDPYAYKTRPQNPYYEVPGIQSGDPRYGGYDLSARSYPDDRGLYFSRQRALPPIQADSRGSISSASTDEICLSPTTTMVSYGSDRDMRDVGMGLPSRAKRPNFPYTDEEQDFITYHREDLGLNWTHVWPRFNTWVTRNGKADRQRGGKAEPGKHQDGRQAVQGIYYRNKKYPVLDEHGNPVYRNGKLVMDDVKVRQRTLDAFKKKHLLAVKLVERAPRKILSGKYNFAIREEDVAAARRQIHLEETGQILSFEKLVEGHEVIGR